MKNKPTVVLGASPKSDRYAYKAVASLMSAGHDVYPIGIREGEIEGKKILTGKPTLPSIDTLSLYIGPARQPDWFDYIFTVIKPQRIICNPGTENPELAKLAASHGVEVEEACTLVLLSLEEY